MNGGLSSAALARQIETSVDEALVRFEKEVQGGKSFINPNKGMVVFPSVLKAGLGIGDSMEKGYSGLQARPWIIIVPRPVRLDYKLGSRSRASSLRFLEADALKRFQESEGRKWVWMSRSGDDA